MRRTQHMPPRIFHRFFRWYCHPKLVDHIDGDLLEVYGNRVQKLGRRRADIRFVIDVLLLFRPSIIKDWERHRNLNTHDMYKNYLKIGLRNLAKNRLFSFINIGGMSLSIASVLIISLFIYDELEFDKHVDDFNLKYRVYNEHFKEQRDFAIIPAAVGAAIVAEFPEVEYCTRYLNFNNPPLFEAGDKKFTESNGGFADASVFEMFSLKLIEGDRRTALKGTNTIAINQSLKEKYFGDQPALGQIIKVGPQNYSVDAVYENFPSHSHLQLNFFISMERFAMIRPDRMQDWGWSGVLTYVKLKSSANAALLDVKMKDVIKAKAGTEDFYIPHLMPLKRVYLHASNQAWDVALHGNIQTTYILMGAGIFILAIAILNFVNLSTSRATNRVKEVGLRKVIGAARTQLIHQFISEALIISFIALVISVAITLGILPYLNSFTEKSISASLFLSPYVVLLLVAFVALIGIAAGSYPAFYISGVNPARILVTKKSGIPSRSFLRKGLVALQFVLSFFLIVTTLTVYRQYNFMRQAKMGFNKDNIVVLTLRADMQANLETTKQLFSNHPNVLSASLCYGLPAEAYAGETIVDHITGNEYGVSMLFADQDYVKTLGLEIVAGRDFAKSSRADENQAFVISETAAKLFGYHNVEDALEHELDWSVSGADTLKKGKVIGVVRDIQLNSMRENVTPIVLNPFKPAYSSIVLTIKPTDVPGTITHLEKTWRTLTSQWPFEYRFLDENFDRMYKSEEKLATLFIFFTIFTISIACVGLFGLVVYSTSQKYKEISIRKVLGASERSVVLGLVRSYLFLLAIACIVAVPFSYYAISKWLESFAFRIPITYVIFLEAGLAIIMISLITVGLQSLKAARANPVNALKEG